ncbi:MAG: chorismate-binding protein [Polaromonas sp.]|uniref:chorismate-binding protein n=1 Tax=Polaromonas sp. TaxID=1869339 RepID=UPI00248A6A29|nr:chorismate-binding protein [Polaromonas sp.]MDI1237731.1 chorismate-binding protein [Polaromonas sp.]
MIDLRVRRSAASLAQVEEALAGLETQPGMYLGVDAGIPALHPLQATLLVEPALALRLYGNGLDVEVLNGFGQALLAQPALASWRTLAVRGPRASGITALRAFLACFDPSPDVLLLGALPFAAHRLVEPGNDAGALGVLFFGQHLLRRDGAGAWHHVALSLPGTVLPASTPTGSPAAPVAIQATPRPVADEPRDDFPVGAYADMVRGALDCLRERPLVSLTLSQSYRRRVQLPAVTAFARLREANPAPASFFVNDGSGLRLFGASPDLQLVVTGRSIQTLPVCGTVARRPGATGEAESLRELLNEEVDAASLAVCTDALRNDLAPLCEPGSLRLLDRRRPMSLATVVHAVDRLEGRLRDGVDAWDAIVATAAPVMVTGTPRAEALRAIAELEASPRGWYGGLMVQVASNGDALAGTILRAAAVRGNVAEVRTGGDLMADSSPEREEQESRLKTLSLWRAFGLEPAATRSTGQPGIALPAAVHLMNAGDPFGHAMRDCLLGLGLDLTPQAPCGLLVGPGEPAACPEQHLVAVGDAALRLLGKSGWTVLHDRPAHGRTLLCTTTAEAPWHSDSPFAATRYASAALQTGELLAGWQAWALDEQGQPVALAHAGRRLVCLLFRPDSMLSSPQALQLLRAALAFAAATEQL